MLGRVEIMSMNDLERRKVVVPLRWHWSLICADMVVEGLDVVDKVFGAPLREEGSFGIKDCGLPMSWAQEFVPGSAH